MPESVEMPAPVSTVSCGRAGPAGKLGPGAWHDSTMESWVGASAQLELTVTDADTAQAIGSGDVPVLGTPRVLALAEAATVRALARRLETGTTTVGSRVELEHRAPTPVGRTVIAAGHGWPRSTAAGSRSRSRVREGDAVVAAGPRRAGAGGPAAVPRGRVRTAS